MKALITQKQEKLLNAVKFGYCEIQNLLETMQPMFYTCGIFGRKADFYALEDKDGRIFWISTGYAPTGSEPQASYKEIHNADIRASQWRSQGILWERRKRKAQDLLYKLCYSCKK